MLYADLVAAGGNVLTLEKDRPCATAFAVRGGRFVFAGSDREAQAFVGPTTARLDLQGKTVTPGFNDAHLHLYWFGMGLLRVADLSGAQSVEELLGRMSEHGGQYDGEWLQGRGFDQSKMAGGQFPTRAELDTLSTRRPILVTRVCGHAAVANSAALARLTAEERAAGDAETGLYTEGAIRAFHNQIAPLSPAEEEAAVLRACDVALSTGITSVQTLLDTPEQMRTFLRLHRKGKLPLRVSAMPPQKAAQSSLWENGIATGFGDERLRYGGAKFFSDGSFGARTALLAEPYADDEDNPQNLGIRIYEPEDLKAQAKSAQEKGWQLVIHAIGDQAVRESLDAIEGALGPGGDNGYHRHRIEHTSLLPPDLMERMAARKIVAVVQPQFVLSDTWTGERVGEARRRGAYPFKSMLDAGIPLALSSDCPVEKLDAFACLAAAVGRHEWSPDETLSPEEALHAYCAGSAYASHEEHIKGTIAPPKLADFVVLSGDPTRLDANGIRALKAEQVYIGGRLVKEN